MGKFYKFFEDSVPQSIKSLFSGKFRDVKKNKTRAKEVTQSLLGNGSSRFVFGGDDPKNIIKMAHKDAGVMQNKQEFQIIQKLSSMFKKDMSRRRVVQEFLPELVDYDKESLYGKKGIPLWLEFKKLKPIDQSLASKFAEKYSLVFEDFYDKLSDIYPLAITFRDVREGDGISIVALSEIKGFLVWKINRFKNYLEPLKNKLVELEEVVQMFEDDYEEALVEFDHFSDEILKKLSIQNSYMRNKIQNHKDYVRLNDNTPLKQRVKYLRTMKKIVDAEIIMLNNAEKKPVSRDLLKLLVALKTLGKEKILIADLESSDNWGFDGTGFKMLDLGFSLSVNNYYHPQNKRNPNKR